MSAKKMPRFTFGAITNIERDVAGIDFRDLSTFLDDNEKLPQVIKSAFKTSGASDADADKWTNDITRGEFIERYSEDMGLNAVKKLTAPVASQ